MSNRFYECDCAANDHTIRVWTDAELGEVMVSTQLAPLLPWYKRIWVAVKYVFNSHRNCSHWHDTVLNISATRKLRNQLNDFLFAVGDYGHDEELSLMTTANERDDLLTFEELCNNLPTFKETKNE